MPHIMIKQHMGTGLNNTFPKHVAIIMDGNGRWAENKGLKRFEGHKAGISAIKKVIRACLKAQIPVLSLFAFSSENWSRPEEEVTFLMQLFVETLQHEVQDLHDNKIRLRFCGNRQGLSEIICQNMDLAEKLTEHNTALVLNLVLNYGGRWDIVQAARRISKEVSSGVLRTEDIDEAVFTSYLATRDLPEPDLFIRTSGEWRLSNFFLWQLAYTEFYFTGTLWPDFTEQEFEKALQNFHQRERRYGKTSQQMRER